MLLINCYLEVLASLSDDDYCALFTARTGRSSAGLKCIYCTNESKKLITCQSITPASNVLSLLSYSFTQAERKPPTPRDQHTGAQTTSSSLRPAHRTTTRVNCFIYSSSNPHRGTKTCQLEIHQIYTGFIRCRPYRVYPRRIEALLFPPP